MKRPQRLTKAQLIRLSPEDYSAIEDAASKLGLPASEITRRSLRIALPILRDINIPGAQRGKEHTQAA